MADVPAARSRRAAIWLYGVIGVFALSAGTLGAQEKPPKTVTREGLIGVWRLVRIDYSGPHGSTVDPFYQARSTGLLIYDKSGWMSVDIAAPERIRFEVPSQRIASQDDANLAASKVLAFDSYYAYHGTWDFNAKSSEVAHHVSSSLSPAENGMTYTQKVSFEGDRLIFTNRSGTQGEETVRRKIWERVVGRN
ncbi:MAG: lipocalin-like domain-containing protein [Steroidobacteraceae bacterium]|jgi:hypothetical protein